MPTGNFLFIFFFQLLSIIYLHINQYISFLHIYHLSIIDRQISCMMYTSQIIGWQYCGHVILFPFFSLLIEKLNNITNINIWLGFVVKLAEISSLVHCAITRLESLNSISYIYCDKLLFMTYMFTLFFKKSHSYLSTL